MRARQLAKAECCNYFRTGPYGTKDHCLLYGHCRVVSGDTKPCSWFIEAVAPQDAEAQAEYLSALSGNTPTVPAAERRAVCKTCGQIFKTTSNRAQYCSEPCRKVARKEQYKASKRRKRLKTTAAVDASITGPVPPLDTAETRIPSGSIYHQDGKQVPDDLLHFPTVDDALQRTSNSDMDMNENLSITAQAECISALGGHGKSSMPKTVGQATGDEYQGEFEELLSHSLYGSDDCGDDATKERYAMESEISTRDSESGEEERSSVLADSTVGGH